LFLKRIEILGFKSFADRTVIELTDGITALLGPNGCGKSNIVDALKWVLGEQSLRRMRAEKMDDVIFSGSENREALSVAEVSLIIANEAAHLEIERPEISIKRRLFRDGESEYYLNGSPVRLKDIREVFFDTGVGKSAYSVMEQGRIDQVLSTRPEERRHIFEEAAGITKYKVKGSEAERKLKKTEENINQVESILSEVRRGYETLKKQTEKTLEYRSLKEGLFEQDRNLKLIQWKELEKKHEKKSKKLQSQLDKHLKLMKKVDAIKATLATELDSVNEMESQLIENQKRFYGMDLEKENLERHLEDIRERRDETEFTRQAAGAREKKAIESLSSLSELRRNRETALAGFRDHLQEIERNIATLQKSINAAEDRLRGNAEETLRVEKSFSCEEEHREELQEKLRSLTDDIVHELDRGLKDSGYDRGARRVLENSIVELMEEIRIRVEGRARLLIDQKQLSSGDAALELLDNAAEDFQGVLRSLNSLKNLFSDYRGSGAAFLEDFLAPEGIITRKRDLDVKIMASAERTKEFKNRIAELSKEKTAMLSRIAKAKNTLEDHRVAQARTATQTAAAEDSLSSLTREAEGEETRLEETRRQIATDEARIRNLDEQEIAIIARRKELEKQQEQLRLEMAELEGGIDAENKSMSGCETKLIELNEERAHLKIGKEKIRLEMSHVEDEIRLLFENFKDRNSRDLAEYAEFKDSIDCPLKEIKEQLATTRKKLKVLGHVNLMAPEEFLEVSERYDFLTHQLDDLRKAKENLIQVTEQIRRETSELFMQTFKEIREHFHEVFRRLFGGGRAEIRLTDQDDPLNSGIEIYAQPPGKRLENISLLSGGEKSLCAVALMFATYQVKPSPFCVLDEIDAALDDANVQRFGSLLMEFGQKSQIMVITHNKKTVTCAQTLIGITMQESGISRLISLKIDGIEQEQSNEEPVTSHR